MMEQHMISRKEALRNLKTADHMINITYPLLKEDKLLLAVLNKAFVSLENSMDAILYFESYNKRIPIFRDNFEEKFNIFKTRCVDRLGISRSYVMLIQEIRMLLKEHRKSSIEFVKDGKVVMCSDNFSMRTLGKEKVKAFISQIRSFTYIMNEIVVKNA